MIAWQGAVKICSYAIRRRPRLRLAAPVVPVVRVVRRVAPVLLCTALGPPAMPPGLGGPPSAPEPPVVVVAPPAYWVPYTLPPGPLLPPDTGLTVPAYYVTPSTPAPVPESGSGLLVITSVGFLVFAMRRRS